MFSNHLVSKPCLLQTLAVFFAAFFLAAAPAAASDRVAFVVGIAEYDHTIPLKNPISDAVGVSTTLETLGFDVETIYDPNLDQLTEATARFEKKLVGAEVALFYFAGHGMQIGRKNYLLARNAKLETDQKIHQEGIELGRILELMEREANVAMAFIDACRDNPLTLDLQTRLGSRNRSLGVSRGLAPVDSSYSNTLVAFATAPGDVAADGEDANSPFAKALMDHMVTPNLEVSTMLKRVTKSVLQDTEGKQQPEVVASMSDEFYFLGSDPTLENFASEQSSLQSVSENDRAMRLLNVARSLKSKQQRVDALTVIFDRFPSTPAADIAIAALNDENAIPQASTSTRFRRDQLAQLNLTKGLQRKGQQALQTTSFEAQEQMLGLTQPDVIKVQTALNLMGYNLGTADGNFGPRSRKALKTFQQAKRVKGTGYLNEATIATILKTYDEAPTDYDGKWVLNIYRQWTRQDRDTPKNKPGMTELLATLELEATNEIFSITDYDIYTFEPPEAFRDFRISISDNRRIQMNGSVSFLFGKRRIHKIRARVNLPQVMPYQLEVSAQGNQVEPEFRSYVTLRRTK
jgi:uncharacterized caspase-like protein